MKASWMIAPLVLGGILTTGVVSVTADSPTPAGGPWRQRLANSPLGRLVMGHVGRLLVLRSELNLTDDQRQQIAGVVKAHRSEILTVAKPIADARRALRNEVMAEKPDEKKIREAAGKLGETLGEAAVLAAKIKGEVRPVLTDEQLKRITDFQAQTDQAVDGFFEKAVRGE